MSETILNIYIVVEKDKIIEYRAKAYQHDAEDPIKIKFLKENARKDFKSANKFSAPINKYGGFMSYKEFYKLEKNGRHFELFEEIFTYFHAPGSPLICLSPVVDGEFIGK